jgi:hypothetical protein
MFAPRVHGPKTVVFKCFHFTGNRSVGRGFAHLFRPTYAGANVGHPSREEGFVLHYNFRAADGWNTIPLPVFTTNERGCAIRCALRRATLSVLLKENHMQLTKPRLLTGNPGSRATV